MSSASGRLFVISAPSGSGKTTVIQALRKKCPWVTRSVSVTTRPPRKNERDGTDYRFIHPAEFLRRKRSGAFLESARILRHWYGTPIGPIRGALGRGQDVVLGVDIQGARQIRKSGLPVTTIFLLPPSVAVLRQRLKRRGTETRRQIEARLRLARRELQEVKRYNYAVVNDRLPEAISAVQAILKAEKHRVVRKREEAK